MIPRIIDGDNGVIVVELDGETLRGWSYANDGERQIKTLCAREYIDGWCHGVKWCYGFDAAEIFPVDGKRETLMKGSRPKRARAAE